MIAEVIATLQSNLARGARSPARQKQALLNAENSLTPLEFQQAVGDLRDRFAHAQIALEQLHLSQLLANEAPTRFVRRPIAPDVTLFCDPDVSPADKSLIIAFCGKSQRLMISTGVFLQLLPSANCDVVILKDPRRNHFVDGSPDYATDFFPLVTRLGSDLGRDRYKDVLCYGTSMGGFAALRCGLLLGTRSISVGGRFPWRVQRMIDRNGETTEAFELLCRCKASKADEFVCVYGECSALDLAAVDHLATMFPVTRWAIPRVEKHNVIHELWKAGTLRQFYRDAFAFE